MTEDERSAPPLELWGGVECTIVRLGDEYRDQTVETGHADRPHDIDLVADLGIRTMRYPILWERIAPHSPEEYDWSWTDERLATLRDRGIRVIGGLTHHGSGPPYTNLLDPEYPRKFAAFAAKVAERYPWIEQWTPVNEPLTTARFAALYGHWYPHKRDHRDFLRALVIQCQGVVAAMRAIRKTIPGAQLVQTEDLGKCYSTRLLAYQARFENERRWLSLDLLCGRVGPSHPMRPLLLDAGVTEEEITEFVTGDGKPDLIGINHYLTSERFLDHRTALYPGHPVGGNGRHAYVDAEAVRVKRLARDTGIVPRLREAWARYGLPMAITEVHHGCHRDEQLRWFAEVWNGAKAARAEGLDLRAVTLWSLFGNVDWRFLLTQRHGFYDTGAFDTRAGRPRPTIVAAAARAFAAGRVFDHPVLDSPGWWRRPPRLYPWSGSCKPLGWNGRKLLITGATGTLGNALARICEHRALPFCLTSRAELDITDDAAIARAIERHRPWAVINAAGFVRVADAEREQEACLAANATGASKLARACAAAGLPFVTFSSDLVFDGRLGRPYVEADPVNPGCIYGLSKARAEDLVRTAMPDALIVRTSAFFGPWDRHNFAWHVLAALSRGETFTACERTEVSPTYVPDLCHTVLDLLIDGETGVWHLANDGRVSWYEFARRIAARARLDSDRVAPLHAVAEPGLNVLASTRGGTMRPFDHALDDYMREMAHHPDLARPSPSAGAPARIEAEDFIAVDIAAE